MLKGILEIFTTISDNDMRIEYLRQGDIINPHQFILGNTARVPIRCVTDVETLELHIDVINNFRSRTDYSSLNTEVAQIISLYEKTGHERFILDYIKKPQAKGDFRDSAVLTLFNENHRKLKNMSMLILLDYRAKNKKQTINEILIGVIQKDKE